MSALLGGGLWQLVLGLLAALAAAVGWALKLRADARATAAEGRAQAERQRTWVAEERRASSAARAEAQTAAAGKSDEELDAAIAAMARAARGEPPAGSQP